MAIVIQLRRDTAANWTTQNPILAEGEFGIETDTLELKFGNGVDTWTALPYFGGAVNSVNGETGTVVLDTDDVSEGAANLYYTEGRVSANADVSANTAKLSGIEAGAEVNDPNTALTNAVQTFTKAQRASITTLASATSITPDFAASNHFDLTLGTNATLENPTNAAAGQSGSIRVQQDGTGSRTLAFGSNWVIAGGTAPDLSTDANAIDRIDYFAYSSTEIHYALAKGIA